MTPKVVIIGGGIQGLSCAYNLGRLGVKDVHVLESGELGDGSSSRSASMIMLQRETPEKVALSVYSYLRYMRFEQEFGRNLRFHRIGFLSVATEQSHERVVEQARMRQSFGIPTEILDPAQIFELEPAVAGNDLTVGIFGPDDGFIDVERVVLAFSSAARESGAKLSEGTIVREISTTGSRVTGVITDDGLIPCDVVVNAAGAGAKSLADTVGVGLPIDNRTRSILLAPPVEGIRSTSPMVEDADHEFYFRPTPTGILFGMGKEPDTEISRDMSPQSVELAKTFSEIRFPPLVNAQYNQGWSGIRCLTPDKAPIIGPVEGLDGYVNCCGWGGEGIQHAPAGGQLAAEFIAFGEGRSLPLTPYLASRFYEGGPA